MTKKKEAKVEKLDKKQIVVGIIILFAAILTLCYAFGEINSKPTEKTIIKAEVNKVEMSAPTKNVVETMLENGVKLSEPVENNVLATTGNKEQEKTPKEAITESEGKEVPIEETKEIARETTEEVVEEKVSENEPLSEKVQTKTIDPQKVVVTFMATLEKSIKFKIYYTQNEGEDFTESMSVSQRATIGTNKYSIILPVKHIYRFRIDYGQYPGNVTIKDIKLLGSQKADLSDFKQYDTNQISDLKFNKDGSVSFSSKKFDPYMIYKTKL